MGRIIKLAILDDFEVFKEDVKPLSNNGISLESHGFMVAATVEKYCKTKINVLYFDIYNANNQGQTIMKSLDQCLKYGVDVIVMSFVFAPLRYRHMIENRLKKLHLNGCIIVAADYNHNKKCGYPASSKYVVGVGNTNKRGIQVVADVKPEFVKCGSAYHIFSGTSKATAIIASNIVEEKTCKTVAKAQNKYDLKQMNFTQKNIYKSICQKGIRNVQMEENIFKCLNDIEDVECIILHVLREFELENQCMVMKYDNFKTLRNLMDFIGKYYEKMDYNR